MKKLFVGLSLVAASSFCFAQEVPDGYLLVPISEMQSWSDELQASEALLTAMLLDLQTLEGDTASLKESVNYWTSEAENWKIKYDELLTDSEDWTVRYQDLNRRFQELRVEFQKLMKEFQGLLDEYAAISKKLKRTRIVAGVGWTAFIATLLALLLGG
jgi:predicted nuclease with TOPRIM domain